LITAAAVVLGLASVSVISDVVRFFSGNETPADAYQVWSRLYIPERVVYNCGLAAALVVLNTFLRASRGVNTFARRAAVGVICGIMAGAYVYANFQTPKIHERDGEVVVPLAEAPGVSPAVKAAAVTAAARHQIAERQLFVVRGKGDVVVNAYALGAGPAAGLFFTGRLLREATPGEVTFAATHEIGHAYDPVYRSEARRYLSVAEVAVCVLIAFVTWAGLQFGSRPGRRKISSPAGMLACLLLLNVYVLALRAFDNVLSWRAESYADSFAAEKTITDEESRRAALGVLDLLAESNPFDPDPPFIIQLMLNSHPSIAERRQKVRDYRPPGGGGCVSGP
jgi:Zn-dependent protease with chaperone function